MNVLYSYCVPLRNILPMKNITLKMNEAVLNRARHVAVDEHKSVSGWVQDLILHELETRVLYEQDRRNALMPLKEGLPLGGKPLTREESHVRRSGRQHFDRKRFLER
jgi:hypothetical protein